MPDKKTKLIQQILFQQMNILLEDVDKVSLSRLLAEHNRASDIAEIVEIVDNQKKRTIFDVLNDPIAAEVLEKVDEATRAELFDILKDDEIQKIISELNPDDAADILSEMPKKDSAELLENIPPKDSAQILKLMRYEEHSAGGIMDPIVITVTPDATVTQAVSKIRAAQIDEDFFSVYVVDENQKFLGDVRLRLLLTPPENTKIKNLLDPDTIYVNADADQEQVRNIFRKNDLIVVPVLDKNQKLVGRITADRVIEVAEEEAAEDIFAMAGTDADELDDVSVFHAAKVRMTWLLPCLIGTGVTAMVLMFFHKMDPVIYIAVFAFVPMIAAISGNAGLQTSAIVVCGLATGHLAAQKLKQVFAREFRVALLVALYCGIIGGIVCSILLNFKNSNTTAEPIRIVFAFAIAMFSAIMVATTLGLFLPFLFRKIGIDPAISAGPLVTTANDSISVTIYMTLALILVQ